MMKYAVIVLLFLCFNLNITKSFSQNEEYGLSAMMFDFDRNFSNWNPIKKELKYPSGISFIYSRQITRYLSYVLPISIGKETNLFNRDGNSDNINVLSGDLAIKLEQLGSWNILSPYLLTGIGGYATNEGGEGMRVRAKVPVGIGFNIKLYRRLYLRIHSTYNREIKRNRGYYIYGAGLNVKLGKDPIRKKSDKDLDPILIASNQKLIVDSDEDGVPDSIDRCPLEAGLLANDGCPLYKDLKNIEVDTMLVFNDTIEESDQLDSTIIVMDDNLGKEPNKEDLYIIKKKSIDSSVVKRANVDNVDVAIEGKKDDVLVKKDQDDILNKEDVVLEKKDVIKENNIAHNGNNSGIKQGGSEEVVEEIVDERNEHIGNEDLVEIHIDTFGSDELVEISLEDEVQKDNLDIIDKTDVNIIEDIVKTDQLLEKENVRLKDHVIINDKDSVEIDVIELNSREKEEDIALDEIKTDPKNKKNDDDIKIVDWLTHDTVYIHDTVFSISFVTGKDKDGDGISDEIDQCPETKGIMKFEGCPKLQMDISTKTHNEISKSDMIKIVETQKEINLIRTKDIDIGQLRFPTGIAALQANHIPVLNQVLELLRKNPNLHLKIYGHTDNEGSNGLNDLLSNNRAKACYEYLHIFHIPLSHLTYEGMGEGKPLEDNQTNIGRSKNRRVAFEFYTL